MLRIVTSDMSIMNSKTRIAATRCSLGTWLCLRNISVDTLHKGDTEEEEEGGGGGGGRGRRGG
jgi:hypothetical protein